MSRNIVRILIGFLMLSMLGAPVMAAEPLETTGTGALLTIGMGARPLAMGGSFVAISDDENALFYNPAGIALLKQVGLTSMYSTQYDVTRYGGVALAGSSFAIGALYLDATDITGAGEDSEIIGAFDYVNIAALAGVAGRLGPLAIGLKGKHLMQTSAQVSSGELAEVTGQGTAADVGVLLQLGPLSVGAVYENIFSLPMRYSNDVEEAWEKRLNAGVSLNLKALKVGLDIEGIDGDEKQLHAGGELLLGPLALRGGMTSPISDSEVDASLIKTADLTAGAGLNLGSFQLDYAYLMPKELPETHRISLTIRF